MVTHTPNLCSAFTHCTHTAHTPGAVAAIYPAVPRKQLGVRCLTQGHLSRGIEGGESAVHSLPPPTIPAGPRLELANFGLRVPLSTIRPLDSCWCFFSSVHLPHFLQGSDQRNGHNRSLVLCSVIHFCVVFEVDVWIIIRFLTESVTYWFFICWYLIESMSRTSAENIGPQHPKYSCIFHCTHGVLFIPVLKQTHPNPSWVFVVKRYFLFHLTIEASPIWSSSRVMTEYAFEFVFGWAIIFLETLQNNMWWCGGCLTNFWLSAFIHLKFSFFDPVTQLFSAILQLWSLESL